MEPYSFTFEFIGFGLSLLAVALFAFLETCITALRVFTLKEISETVSERYKPLLTSLETNPHRMLITILIAVSLANVTAASLATRLIENLFTELHLSQGVVFSLGIAITTSIILIFGEIIPKNFAKTHGENLFRSTLWFSNAVFYLLYPFVTFLLKISDFVMHRIAKTNSISQGISAEKEIKFMIDYLADQGLMETEKTDMLRNILTMGQTPIREIMVPEQDIIAVTTKITIKEAIELFSENHFSRVPVYTADNETIIGFIHQKDILMLASDTTKKTIKDYIRPISFVPEAMKANQLLQELKKKNMHMAIVLNEFGSITGLVTLEDTLEEIVGEIHDEFEISTKDIIQVKDGGWLVDGSTDLEDIEKVLNISFKPATAITMSGFICEQLQHVPKKGDQTMHQGFSFSVQKATPRRVRQVMVEKQ
ncbi:MAG: hemolysin family protein [Candidatus Babeliales bacterium]